jgi:hypothetical protein
VKKISLKKNILGVICAMGALLTSTVSYSQTMSTYAGTGTASFTGDGGAATLATMRQPNGVATDAAGNVYVCDNANFRIRKITTAGVISTIAGTGATGYSAAHEGVVATTAFINATGGIKVDGAGNIYFADLGNNIIRKISTTGIITTIAGTPPPAVAGYSGDGGAATAAKLNAPYDVAVDAAGNVYIADQGNHCIRKITAAGTISTICGNGLIGLGAAGDGGPAVSAKLNYPHSLDVDAAGNIYISDYGNNRIRKINTAGTISTIVGAVGLPYGYTGDGGPATAARIYYPEGLDVDNAGNLYFCDWTNHAIRKVGTTGIINTIAGTGTSGSSGDGGLATLARLNRPTAVAVRASDGDVFIADNENNKVRRIKVGDAPFFTAGLSRTVTVCPIEFTTLDSAVRVDDLNVGETLTWSGVDLPSNGTLVASYSTLSTGSTVTPLGITYAPFTGFVGLDTFTVRVTDGIYSDTITIYITSLGTPDEGAISGADSVCPGLSITLTNTATGGTWSSSNTALATVSGSGVVTGVTAGSVTISYFASNFCATTYTTHTVRVLATVPCISSVVDAANSAEDKVTVTPNPSKGTFSVKITSAIPAEHEVAIYDVTGRKLATYRVLSNKSTQLAFDGGSGMYMLMIGGNGKKQTVKLIVE